MASKAQLQSTLIVKLANSLKVTAAALTFNLRKLNLVIVPVPRASQQLKRLQTSLDQTRDLLTLDNGDDGGVCEPNVADGNQTNLGRKTIHSNAVRPVFRVRKHGPKNLKRSAQPDRVPDSDQPSY